MEEEQEQQAHAEMLLPKMPVSLVEVPDFNRMLKDLHKTHTDYILEVERAHKVLNTGLTNAIRRGTLLTKENNSLREELSCKKRGRAAATADAPDETERETLKSQKMSHTETKSLEFSAISLAKISTAMKVHVHGIEDESPTNYVRLINMTVASLLRMTQLNNVSQ
jgi:hypothetical protein